MEIDFKKADRIVETLLSRIFFFGEKVYKFYKWKKAFYGDLSDANFRKQFIKEDFFWNNVMSPEIYKKLAILKNEDGREDLCIMMNKLKSQKNLIDCVESSELTFDILKKFVADIIKKQREIASLRKEELTILLTKDLKNIEVEAIKDLRSWDYMAKELPKQKIDQIAEKLLAILRSPEYSEWRKVAKKSACIDGNGDNFIIENGEIVFIDILPPKYNWRVEDEVFNLGRAVADIRALGGNPKLAEAIYESYEKITGLKAPEAVKKLYEIRGAMIQVAYRYLLNQPQRAEKYLRFAEDLLF